MMSHSPTNEPNARKPSATLTLRLFQTMDNPVYCALFQRIFGQPPWNETWTLDEISRELDRIMAKPGFIGIAAEYQSHLAGFFTGYRLRFPLLPSFFYLDQLFVDDRHRGMGAGRALLGQGLSLAADQHYRGMLLLTKPGSASEGFYRQNGFGRVLPFARLKGKLLLYRSLRQREGA
jgi:GNAT superfamily N-acetyltransferase